MKVTIDNRDGAGARDYSTALAADGSLTIARALNQPSRCNAMLHVGPFGLPVPVRGARVVVTSDSGAVLFDGSLATTPERVYAGTATTGPVHRVVFNAVSDDVPLPEPGSGATHAVTDGDGVVRMNPLPATAVRELAQDVTISGELEPTAYITEYFLGDGATEIFQLTQAPFHPANSTLMDERFDEAEIDSRVWSVADPGSFLSLTSRGLTLNGGNGQEGQTTLTGIAQVELGGTLTFEADGVALSTGSDGVVCGIYSGAIERDSCLAGFNVRQSGGTTIVTPLVNGVEVGTSLIMLNGHRYTLRVRVHCPEIVRENATYTALADGVAVSFGGGAIEAPISLVLEARDMGLSSNTPSTVLYTGAIANSPGSCSFAVVNSVQLFGSIARCSIVQAGSAWIVSTATDGTQTVRVTGAAGDGVDCTISPAGRITFYSGRIPLPNERIAVTYRGRRRAVARLGEDGVAQTARWQGKVSQPAARTTLDCENAALSMLSFAASRSAAVAGSWEMVNPADVQAGDVLAITADDDDVRARVRAVTIENGHARPEILHYRVDFANHWSESLGMKLAETTAADAVIPRTTSSGPSNVLTNLSALQVVSATGTALVIEAGTEPPAGGGFEVRRRDWAFRPGTDADLVLRSPVRSFTISREGQVERYFVRMYDASNPPVYSRFSSAVFTNLPVDA